MPVRLRQEIQALPWGAENVAVSCAFRAQCQKWINRRFPGAMVLVEAIEDKDIEPPLWREHDIALLKSARDADGSKLKAVRVLAPRRRYWKGNPGNFAACYSNAYVANGAVIGARFGDAERDERSEATLLEAPRYSSSTYEFDVARRNQYLSKGAARTRPAS